jgi:rhodanese-related sulfurtransferase
MLKLAVLARDLAAFLVLATISLAGGLLINQFRDKPLPLLYASKKERIESAVAKTAATERSGLPAIDEATEIPSAGAVGAAPKTLRLVEFRDFVGKRSGVVLDARPEIFHRLGHIPGAVSLPREDFEQSYAKLRSVLERDKSQPIVVYCSGSSCEDSKMVAEGLVKLGYTHVFVFKGGWDEWNQAGLPQEPRS